MKTGGRICRMKAEQRLPLCFWRPDRVNADQKGLVMNLYFAPLEGIGGYIYRSAQAEFFGKADKYFSPFISPAKERRIRTREYRDVCPENNGNIRLIPQILTNDAELFCRTAEELAQMGYKEVNLNLGCPSKTVVTKYCGAGFLGKPELLDIFLEQICEKAQMKISIKTRIGMEDPEEFEHLLEIYNKYPLEELIIHPRVQTDYYTNHPRMETFCYAVKHAAIPLVYNGDIFSAEDYHVRMMQILPGGQEGSPDAGAQRGISAVMLGRGVLADPALFGEIRGTERLEKKKLQAFHDKLLADYTAVLSGETNVLYKMKELWFYMIPMFENYEKYAKRIRKSRRICDYKEAVRSLFAEQELKGR